MWKIDAGDGTVISPPKAQHTQQDAQAAQAFQSSVQLAKAKTNGGSTGNSQGAGNNGGGGGGAGGADATGGAPPFVPLYFNTDTTEGNVDTPPFAGPAYAPAGATAGDPLLLGAADEPAAVAPEITVENEITKALKPVQQQAQQAVDAAQGKLDASTAKAGTTQQQLDALYADIDANGASPAKLARAKRLEDQLAAERGQVENDQKDFDAANAKLTAVNTALYAEQLKADQKKAAQSKQAADGAYSDFKALLPPDVTFNQGDQLTDEQLAALTAEQRAAYFRYLKAQSEAVNDQNKVNATTIALNQNHAQWQAYASDPKYGNIAKVGLKGVNDALRPLNLRMNGPAKIDPAKAQQNLAEINKLAPYYYSMWNASSAWMLASGDVIGAQIVLADMQAAQEKWRRENPYVMAPGSRADAAVDKARQDLILAQQKAQPLLLDYEVKAAYAGQLQAGLGLEEAKTNLTAAQTAYDKWRAENPHLAAPGNSYEMALAKAKHEFELAQLQMAAANKGLEAASWQQYAFTLKQEEIAAWKAANNGDAICIGSTAQNVTPAYLTARDRAKDAKTRADALSTEAGRLAGIVNGLRLSEAGNVQADLDLEKARQNLTAAQTAYDKWRKENRNLDASGNSTEEMNLAEAQRQFGLAQQKVGVANLALDAASWQFYAYQLKQDEIAVWKAANNGDAVCMGSTAQNVTPAYIAAREKAKAAQEKADTLSLQAGKAGIDFQKLLAQKDIDAAQAAVDAEQPAATEPKFVLVGYTTGTGGAHPAGQGNPQAITPAEKHLAAAKARLQGLEYQAQQADYFVQLNQFLLSLPEHLKNPVTEEDKQELARRQDEFFRPLQFKQGPIDGQAAIAQVDQDLKNQQRKLDSRGWMHSGTDWVNENVFQGDRSELETYLQNQLSSLKTLEEERKAGMDDATYQAKLKGLMDGYGEKYLRMSAGEAKTDGVWAGANEITRIAAATIVGVAATVAGGGVNVFAGAAAGFAVYQAWDTADDAAAAFDGGDITADGHLSLAGLTGLTKDAVDGEIGWDQWGKAAKLGGQDLLMNTVSSFATAGGAAFGVRASAWTASRFMPGVNRLPFISLGKGSFQGVASGASLSTMRGVAAVNMAQSTTTRVFAVNANFTAIQAGIGAGQTANTAIRLGFNGKLLTPEGRDEMKKQFANQAFYIGTSFFLIGPFVALLPFKYTWQIGFEGVTNVGQEEARARLIDNRRPDFLGYYGAGIGILPGVVMNRVSRNGARDYPELTAPPAAALDSLVTARANELANTAGRPGAPTKLDQTRAEADVHGPLRPRALVLQSEAGASGSLKPFLELAHRETAPATRLWELSGRQGTPDQYRPQAARDLRIHDEAYALWTAAGSPKNKEFVFWAEAAREVLIQERAAELWKNNGSKATETPKTYLAEARAEFDFFAWQDKAPDIRIGYNVRGRPTRSDTSRGVVHNDTNTNIVGSPTLASYGQAVGTKSGLRALGRGVVNSWHLGSWAPFRDAWNRHGQVSVRPTEYKNVPLYQLGLHFLSNQTAFQLKATEFVKAIENVLAAKSADSPFTVHVRAARRVGSDPSGKPVIELSVGFGLKANPTTVPRGHTDFLGTPGNNKAGDFVELTQGAPYNKVLTEKKMGLPRGVRNFLMLRYASGPGFLLKLLNPRWAIEVRPELALPGGLPKEAKLSRLIYEQNQAALGQINMKVQVLAKDAVAAQAFINTVRNGKTPMSLETVRLTKDIDSTNPAIFVPGIRSGMRLSAIPAKPGRTEFADLRGKTRRVWDPDQTNIDILFNDRYHSNLGRHVPNLDRVADRPIYAIQRRLANTALGRKLGATPLQWAHSPHAPQPHTTPLQNRVPFPWRRPRPDETSMTSLWTTFRDMNPKAPTRITFALFLRAIFRATTTETRFMWKTNPASEKPGNVPRLLQNASPETIRLSYTDPTGSHPTITVPKWLKDELETANLGSGFRIATGGKARDGSALPGGKQPLLNALQDIEGVLPASEHPRIAQLRTKISGLQEGGFIPPAITRDLLKEFVV
jgi:hypothetical protein